LPKASYGLKGRARRYRGVLSRLTRGDQPNARKRIAAGSVDAVERGHDILWFSLVRVYASGLKLLNELARFFGLPKTEIIGQRIANVFKHASKVRVG
jgi:hypothetical protein